MLKSVFVFILATFSFQIYSQVVGSRDNSAQSPGSVDPAQLSGGGFTGDVNVFNGSYHANYPLGSVSTPGGLSYGLELSYSPSFSAGTSPSICSGVPYGEGWNVPVPMITVSNAAYFSFLAEYECYIKSQVTKDTNNYYTDAIVVNGVERPASRLQGDVFWFSPNVSIPGVVSGRAVFKYIDEDDAGCAVFVLNKFENYIELRFYGDSWTVFVDNGDQYQFSTNLVTYRSPNNQRVLDYDTYDVLDGDNEVIDIIADNDYGLYKEPVLNVIEPKQAFTSWYCSSISNKNLPNQFIQFEYEKFGAFNYYQEFEQGLLAAQISSKLRGLVGSFTPDYTSYTDVLLTKVTSLAWNSRVEILDLNYAMSDLIGAKMLDPNDPGVERLDSLYAYETVYSDGLDTDQFENWKRYYHGKSEDAYSLAAGEPMIASQNPYVTTSGNGTAGDAYIRKDVIDDDAIGFNHGFLESPRILTDGIDLVPGDIYEVRTRITDSNGADNAMGTGTIDINIATGDLNFSLPYTICEDLADPIDSCTYYSGDASTYSSLNNNIGNAYPDANYYDTRRTSVFTTFNQAIKWHIPTAATSVSTSNFFVMPNIPNHCDGMNIQVGPGNSDTDYSQGQSTDDFQYNIAQSEVTPTEPSAYNTYWHTLQSATNGAAYEDVPYNFGIGVPWSMVEPLYIQQMGSYASPYDQTEAYEFWWNDDSGLFPWANEPTKFDEEVKLDEVELIRYSKVPYMLSEVKMYRVNGEVTPLDDTSSLKLVAQSEMEYSYDSKSTIENAPYDYTENDTLIHSSSYTQYVYTLDLIKNIPVAGWENNPSVADTYEDSTLLQTEFEYEWYGYNDDDVLVSAVDGKPARRTRVMSKYIDQLGGETHIEYYPYNSTSTLREGRYTGVQKCAVYNADPVMGQNGVFDMHPAVKYLTKLDEKNNVSTIIPEAPLKRWEYIYDTTQIIYQSFDYYLPGNFRGGYKKSYSKGFAQTTVMEPSLETGEQNYTIYYHHGNVYEPAVVDGVIIPDTSTIMEYLYFGKPEKIERYNSADEIEEATLFEYGFTKAHENGYARNKIYRDNMPSTTDFQGVTNWVHGRNYEYRDYYRNELEELTDTIIGYAVFFSDGDPGTDLSFIFSDASTTTESDFDTLAYLNYDEAVITENFELWKEIPETKITLTPIYGTLTGDDAKPYLIRGYIGENWGGPLEKPKYLETYFYTDLAASNPDFYFHSYFVKTEKQITRSYDEYCYFDDEDGGYPSIPIGETVDPNPFGPPYSNPTSPGQNDGNYINAINASSDGTSVESMLVSASPLSENVLDAFTAKIGTFQSSVVKNVLVAQSALEDDQLLTVFNGMNYLSGSDINAIYNDQPYLSDPFLISIVNGSSQYSDQLIKMIYTVNDSLSDTVIVKICESSSFSQNVLKDVFLLQNQLSEEVLVEVAKEGNSNAAFAIDAILMNQPILTDTIFYEVAENANLGNNKVRSVFSNAQVYPSDNALIALMNRTPGLSEQDLVGIFQASDHYFGDSLITKIYAELSLSNADQAIEYQGEINPYGLLCDEDLICGRDYVESITEYQYYEADYEGKTLAEGFKKLMGLEDVEGKIVLSSESGLSQNDTLSTIQLKHQPSWQVFSVKSYSPDYLDNYSKEEYFYYYDQLNRKSREIPYYDYSEGAFYFDDDPEYYLDTVIFSSNWPADHGPSGDFKGHIPLSDGEKISRRNNLRAIAFQKSIFTKNTSVDSAILRSEYYNYDSRWNRPLMDVDSTITYNGPYCGDTDTLECDECYSIKWDGDEEEAMAEVLWGYCAYFVAGGVLKCCPMDVNPEDCGYTVYSTFGCQPEGEDPALDTLTKAMIPELAIDNALYFRSFVVQIDTISVYSNEWLERTDSSNAYIADFYLTDVEDDENRRISEMVYPFDTLTVRTIDQRNKYSQIQLEHDVSEIYTKYDYDTTYRIWYDNINAAAECYGYGDYSVFLNTNIGLPTRITVGHGREDSMSTVYAYYPNASVDSIVDPNGHRVHYTYDDYDRLEKTYENSRLLSENNYVYWKRDTSLNFQERTAQNYVETKVYSGPGAHDEHIRAYMDPLGRNYSAISTIDNDSTQIHTGTVWYDNWGRVDRAFKPYKLAEQNTLIPTSDTTLAYTHSLFENTPKSRTLRAAKYGITDIMDTHTIKQNYSLIDEAKLACELGLKAPEAAMLIHPEFDGDFKYIRVETIDEDGKKMITYSNAIGQQVATMQFGESETDELITLFSYDAYGNLTKVINPEEQVSEYRYNLLGQLIQEKTIDAGTVNYMYNKQGLLSISQDEMGREGDIPPLEVDSVPFFRVYEYDDYGRLKTQKRCFWWQPEPIVENNEAINPLFYVDTLDGVDAYGDPLITGINPESYFEYTFSNRSTYDWLAEINYVYHPGGPASRLPITGLATNFINLDGGIAEKSFVYGEDSTANQLGKLEKSLSYDADGNAIETTTYTFNEEGQVKSELIDFNPTGEPEDQVITKITYPDYSYRGSLQQIQVDIGNDDTLDFQYTYQFDKWNRLREVYVSFVEGEMGNRVVSYNYDDALGIRTETKHYVNSATCGEHEALTVEYDYDIRDRLTSISSDLFDYYLYYDNNLPTHADFTETVSASQNWNGNINGTVADYKLDGLNVTNGGNFDGDPEDLFYKATVYGYQYDMANRLYLADAHAGELVNPSLTNSYGIGDVEYNYDRIGNITNLKRGTGLDEFDELINEEWNYQYFTGTNQLKKVQGVGGTTSRNYTYDANGNLATDDYRNLDAIDYARANYPFHITKDSKEIDYLYSVSNQRIYKNTQDALDTTCEYYLKNIGILDMQSNNWTWYVSGAERAAKIAPKDYQQPKNINSSSPTILNDTLAASFYLYDHLGNTRVVYYPEVQCPTFVTYTIENATDYYPYGKTLRQFITTPPEKFLTTQHERDQETGLDYRGARFYDADIARFNSLDPLAANYPSLSDYSYVVGNPVMYIDPTGMAVEDIYSVDENGHLRLERKTNHNFDIIYKRDDKAQFIEGSAMRVNDQTLLSQIDKGAEGFIYAHFASTDNKKEAFKLFYYMANNTNVEWGLQAFRKDNEMEYRLTTSHTVDGCPAVSDTELKLKLEYQIHTHPDLKEGSKGGSGWQDANGYWNGDMGRVIKRYNWYNSRGLELPKHYVYHKGTKNLYNYDPWNQSIFIKKITSYQSLMFLK